MLSPISNRLVPFSVGRPIYYADKMHELAPKLWYRLLETSGTVVNDSGSLALNSTTAGDIQLNQTLPTSNDVGVLVEDHSPSTQGVINLPVNSGWTSLTAFSWMFFVYLNAYGGAGNTACRFQGNTQGYISQHDRTTNRLTVAIRGSSGTTNTVTSTTLSISTKSVVIWTYNDLTDRKPHVYFNGAEASYVAQPATLGTLLTNTTVSHTLLSNQISGSSVNNVHGYCGEIALFGTELTAAQIATLSDLLLRV